MTLLKVYNRFKLDVAVTGDSGSGKSSLINSLLGLDADANGAAPTGVVETTMKPAVYQYPYCSQVRLWDLPGMGTPCFTSKSYVETMNFNVYDMFFVVVSERFRENNMLLINEIHKQNKPFYIIRTKVDCDLHAQSRKRNFIETAVLNEMRDECLKYVEEKNLRPHIFLVSAHNKQHYEMQNLKDTFKKEAPELKREVFPLFLANLFSGNRWKQRTNQRHALKIGKINEKEIQGLKTFCRCFDTSNGTEILTTTLEALDNFQLDVAILGETESEVTTFLNDLMRKQNDPFGSVIAEMPATSPQYPNVKFWPVSCIENIRLNSLESMTGFLDLFDFYVLIVPEWKEAHHLELARVVEKLQKQYHFVQTKTECLFQAHKHLCCSETDIMDALRVQCTEELQKANGDNSQIFLINSVDRNVFEFVGFESVLGCNLDTIRTSAFVYYIDRIVQNKNQANSSCQIL